MIHSLCLHLTDQSGTRIAICVSQSICTNQQISSVCWLQPITGDYISPPTTTATRLSSLGLPEYPLSCSLNATSSPSATTASSAAATTRTCRAGTAAVLVPVSLQMLFEPMRLIIHSDFNEMYAVGTHGSHSARTPAAIAALSSLTALLCVIVLAGDDDPVHAAVGGRAPLVAPMLWRSW
jgi:hypothetical protein